MKSFGMTDVGKERSINQDYIFFTDEPVGKLQNLYIVADGMGGHKAGDKASSFAVERFVELMKECSEEEPFYMMKKVLDQVNEELLLLAKSAEEYEGMGTTFVCACVQNDRLHIMNIGDSRLYLMSDHFEQITRDHSLVEELVRNGQLTKEEARVHPQKNMITKAVGADSRIEPDFFELTLERGDEILLCSDGLSNMMPDKKIETIMRSGSNLKKKANELIREANEQGGLDNIAVVVAIREEER